MLTRTSKSRSSSSIERGEWLKCLTALQVLFGMHEQRVPSAVIGREFAQHGTADGDEAADGRRRVRPSDSVSTRLSGQRQTCLPAHLHVEERRICGTVQPMSSMFSGTTNEHRPMAMAEISELAQ